MKELFKKNVLVPFHMADPAGIMFFGNIFSLVHQTFEVWLAEASGGWGNWFNNPKWIAPIRRAEVDYLKPLRAGETFEVSFKLKETSESSFLLQIDFVKNGVTHVTLHTRQVFCDRKTIQKIAIPAEAKKVFGL